MLVFSFSSLSTFLNPCLSGTNKNFGTDLELAYPLKHDAKEKREIKEAISEVTKVLGKPLS